jgi:putative transposase
MLQRYRFRIYPGPAVRERLAVAFGCARRVYNDGLQARIDAFDAGRPFIDDNALSRLIITEAKRTPERAWLADVSTAMLQQALIDLNTGFRYFFGSLSGRRKGRKFQRPRFRSRKDNRQVIRFAKNAKFKVLPNGRLRLPKIGDIKVRWSRQLPSVPSSVVIIRDRAGRYFASFVVRVDEQAWPLTGQEVGIDLGLTHFAVFSDGSKVDAPRFLRRAERKLRHLHKGLNRKVKGSASRRKSVDKLARAYAHVSDTRRDWQHKLSTQIIRDNQAVYVETLSVAGLGRTRLAKSIHDAAWAQFLRMLDYKSARYGRDFVKVGRFEPTTRRCSTCGVVGDRKPLHIRTWTCSCGSQHDRDVNAAINILAAGRADKSNACGVQVRPVHVPAPRGEAGIRRSAARS